MLLLGFGSRLLSDTSHQATSKAASCSLLQVKFMHSVGSVGHAGSAAVTPAARFASLEATTGIALPPCALVNVAGGAAPAQYSRLECIAEARLAACMAASERCRAMVVLESASACILAMPSRPTQMTTTATMTSTRLKPRELTEEGERIITGIRVN